MKFKMKLHSSPFSMIESVEKTIELRLYDEKRKQITVGDTICFSNIENPDRTILTKVKEILVSGSFDELDNAFPLVECGYTAETIKSASPKDMLKYYTPEQEEQYGVIGIRVEVQQ